MLLANPGYEWVEISAKVFNVSITNNFCVNIYTNNERVVVKNIKFF